MEKMDSPFTKLQFCTIRNETIESFTSGLKLFKYLKLLKRIFVSLISKKYLFFGNK